jgi:2-C-methyl-D-erythritol 4-phosphate cytidylyltransferase
MIKPELFSGILLAAGIGRRFGTEIPKQFCEIKPEYTILEKSLEALLPVCQQIILVLPQNYQPAPALLKRLESKTQKLAVNLALIKGGFTRQQSVAKAFTLTVNEYVVIHDAARPLLDHTDLENLLENVIKFKAAILASPIPDTIKQSKDRFIGRTVDRTNLWAAQTPQAFDRLIFSRALELAQSSHFEGTDDASLLENLGFPVKLVEAHHLNFKITHQKDLKLLKQLISTD